MKSQVPMWLEILFDGHPSRYISKHLMSGGVKVHYTKTTPSSSFSCNSYMIDLALAQSIIFSFFSCKILIPMKSIRLQTKDSIRETLGLGNIGGFVYNNYITNSTIYI